MLILKVQIFWEGHNLCCMYQNFNITDNLSFAVLRAGVDFCQKLIPGEIFVLLSLLIFRRVSDFPGLILLNEKNKIIKVQMIFYKIRHFLMIYVFESH